MVPHPAGYLQKAAGKIIKPAKTATKVCTDTQYLTTFSAQNKSMVARHPIPKLKETNEMIAPENIPFTLLKSGLF